MFPSFWKILPTFRQFYSSRPRLGVSTERKFSKIEIKTGFLLPSGVDLVRPLNWNSKIGRNPNTNFENSFKIYFLGHLHKTIKSNSKSSYQDRSENHLTKIQSETPLLKTSTLQETVHKIWLILKPKTYCFPPLALLTGKTRPKPLGLHRQNPAKNSNTWKTFQEAYFPKN